VKFGVIVQAYTPAQQYGTDKHAICVGRLDESQRPDPRRPQLPRVPHMPAKYAGIYGARKVWFRPKRDNLYVGHLPKN